MDVNNRGFKEIPLVATNSQFGPGERFPSPEYRTSLRQWRENLTVLSQVYNLYFVACNNEIHVYKPSFPDQILSRTPELVIHPPVSAPRLPGYISPDSPHSINNIIVDFLGNEEIILFACDDGDVLGYQTKYIQQTIEGRNRHDDFSIRSPEPQPFFHENVQKSAWGLAVHREARMIAVSANTCRITVFAFALVQRRMSPSNSDSGSELDTEMDASSFSASEELGNNEDSLDDFPTIRARDHRIVLDGSTLKENIPCLAFCNLPDDTEGRWLMSGTIAGSICIWDIHKKQWAHAFATGFCKANLEGHCNCSSELISSYRHSVWAVSWLDWRSFRRADTLEAALGSPEVDEQQCSETISGQHSITQFWDISNTRNEVRESGIIYGASGNNIPANTLYPGQQETFLSYLQDTKLRLNNISRERKPQYMSPIDPKDIIDGPIPAYPILVVACKDVILRVPQPSQHVHLPFQLHDAHSGMHQPLYQIVQPEKLPCPWSYHRHNMTVTIPELGVIVVGSGMGRAGIFSLTTTGMPYTYNDGRREYHDIKDAFTFRLDHIVPFTYQERAGDRPVSPLCGIAVGPVQGMLGRTSDRSRRWRLLLTYIDQSVMSYELGKSLDAEEETLECLVI